MSWHLRWAAVQQLPSRVADRRRPAEHLPVERLRSPRRGAQDVEVQAGGRAVKLSYRPSMLAEAEGLLAQDPAELVTWWKLVVFQAVDEHGPVESTPELIADSRQAILRDYRLVLMRDRDAVRHAVHRLTTGDELGWFYAARQRGGTCAVCGKPLAAGEPVYLEWFALNRTAYEVGSVGAECAAPESLRNSEGQKPAPCISCGRRMYYELADLAQAPTCCSRYCTFVGSYSAKRVTG
jgi:hypothetical protein